MHLLDKAVLLEKEASDFGFEWENHEQIMAQIRSECQEIHEQLTPETRAINQQALQEEIGDLLHAAFSLCVFCNFSPKDTLEKTLNKFERRLHAVKAIAAEQGLDTLKGHTFDALMDVWQEAKGRVG